MNIEFELPKEQSSIIKVIGVGGGGSNAVNHMFRSGIEGVNFFVANTDKQALASSPVPEGNKIPLGVSLTEGRGAGMNPETGKRAMLESIEDLKLVLESNTKMVFITACMGKGTGTGGAPVLAKAAREMGILTVGLVTLPFGSEGKIRFKQAQQGIDELKEFVDTLLVISNDKIRQLHGDLGLSAAFSQADNVLTNAAKSIAEIITVAGYINVDFEDVKTVMRNSGVAIMGTATASGPKRALDAIGQALSSPLLNDNNIRGAKHVLINITSGKREVTIDEVSAVTDFVQEQAGYETNVIWGNCRNEDLGDELSVTLIATGFHGTELTLPFAEETRRPVEQPATVPVAEVKIKPAPERVELLPVAEIPLEFEITNEIFESTENISADSDSSILNESVSETEPLPVITDPVNLDPFIVSADLTKSTGFEPVQYTEAEQAELKQRNAERVKKLIGLSVKVGTPQALAEAESVPAYKRRDVKLDEVQHSSETNISRLYLSDVDSLNGVDIKTNNSFLHAHDKVD